MFRARKRVKDFEPSVVHAPIFPNEENLDAINAAKEFLNEMNQALAQEINDSEHSFQKFGLLFEDDSIWKDEVTLTFDKRTLRGRSNILKAWQQLQPSRKASNFQLADESLWGVAEYQRYSPDFATLSFKATFELTKPASSAIANFMVIPHTGKESTTWRIWSLTTAIRELDTCRAQKLPRPGPEVRDGVTRGIPEAQGLPSPVSPDRPLDAIVMGASLAGLTTILYLEAFGVSALAVEKTPKVGNRWDSERYENLAVHNFRDMVGLPYTPMPKSYSDYPSAIELGTFWRDTVRDSKLPVHAGVELVKASWDNERQLFAVTLRDTTINKGKECVTYARNVVICDGYWAPQSHPYIPLLKGRENFKGTIIHSTEYRDSSPFIGNKAVIVGVGPSAHDIAGNLVRKGGLKDVTIVQRTPRLLADQELLIGTFFKPLYNDKVWVDRADFQMNTLPMPLFRDLMMGAVSGIMTMLEDQFQKLESKGYMIDRSPSFAAISTEMRGGGYYPDQPKVFDLVFEDRIKIASGEAVGCTDSSLVLDSGIEIPADLIVLATGHEKFNEPELLRKQGILEPSVTSQLENVGDPHLDEEGQDVGSFVSSGHPHIFFCSSAFVGIRYNARFTAIQIAADVTGQRPSAYPREL